MPGGPKEAYERVRPVFEAVAAKVSGDPCVTWLGPGSAGHFVKMVHNGIEYAVMQLIAETYDLMKRGLALSDDQLREVFSAWNKGELNGYLVEITSHIFSKVDERTGQRLIDEILDVAKQKGTGMWTSQSAMELQVPIPTIDLAVAMRDLSVFAKERELASAIYQRSPQRFTGEHERFLTQLGRVLALTRIPGKTADLKTRLPYWQTPKADGLDYHRLAEEITLSAGLKLLRLHPSCGSFSLRWGRFLRDARRGPGRHLSWCCRC
jgi:6-phosphogluconate dehydrogenase